MTGIYYEYFKEGEHTGTSGQTHTDHTSKQGPRWALSKQRAGVEETELVSVGASLA